MSNARFMYLSVQGRRVGCVAVRVDRDNNAALYETSHQHPNDVFSKEKARVISSGRLEAHPRSVPVPAQANAYQISSAVMHDLLSRNETPSKARLAAEEWLAHNSEK